MELRKLKEIVSKLPQKPGVYFFLANDGKYIYVGKAASLKSRVLNYIKTFTLNKAGLAQIYERENGRIRKMVEMAKSLKYITTDSDIEALILESQYIKKRRPIFNIVMRDDKQYFYVGFSNDKFPKVFLTHQPQTAVKQSTDFVGPFTEGSAIKTTLRYLRNIFPYCTCKQKHNNYCLNYHIGKCLGFCCLKQQKPNLNLKSQNEKLYNKNTKALKDILSGKKNLLIQNLEREMRSHAKNHNFQEAIQLRNRLEKLRRVFQNAQIIKDNKYSDMSIYHYGDKVIKFLREKLGLKKLPRRIEAYDISNIQGQNATGSMAVFILRQDSGQVKWKSGKNEYRRFKIGNKYQIRNPKFKKVSGFGFRVSDLHSGGDTGMLREVLDRRLNHPEWPMPDLIIVDGGKQQLNAATDAIQSRISPEDPTPISIIALTKNKKHSGVKLNTRNGEIPLSSLPLEIKNLILHINSEAHYFAINYYRKLHRKSLH